MSTHGEHGTDGALQPLEMQTLTAPVGNSQNAISNSAPSTDTGNRIVRPEVPAIPYAPVHGTKLPSRITRHFGAICAGLGACALFIFAAYYSYQALISTSPALGKLFFLPQQQFLCSTFSHKPCLSFSFA